MNEVIPSFPTCSILDVRASAWPDPADRIESPLPVYPDTNDALYGTMEAKLASSKPHAEFSATTDLSACSQLAAGAPSSV